MFNTTKSKIAAIVFSMLIILSFVLSAFSYVYLKNSKSLIIKSCSYTIGQFAQNINKEIARIEDNARDLALAGKIHFESGKEKSDLKYVVKNILENYTNSLGGGLWYFPYSIDNSRLYSVYVYKNKDNKIVTSNLYESLDYNYQNQKWFSEISNNISRENDVAWSTPYFEKEANKTFMITAGSGIYENNRLIGISSVDWGISSIVKAVYDMRPTEGSFALFADEKNDRIIVSTDPNLVNAQLTGKSLDNIPWYRKDLRNLTYIKYKGKKFLPYVKNIDNGMVLIVCVPKNELFHYIYVQVEILFSILILISFLISIFLYIGLNNNITKPINILMNIANKISKGDTNLEIKLEKPKEFAHLASTFDKMLKDIQDATKKKEKIESELSIAKQIQSSSLPDVFPAYPERYDFDIFASMNPAYDVGGDFYDFYFIDKNKLMFLIADVSGKGVPAALFMMTVKTLINVLSKTLNYCEFIKEVNNTICSNNKQGYFVTCFIGIFDFEKEKLICINCGHNPPLIKHKDGEFEYLDINSNIVLGAMEDMDFEIKELDFKPGYEVFLYTDGVTEAMNENNELYSEERLRTMLNESKDDALSKKCKKIKEDIALYSKNVEQSDDITMLAFKYEGKSNKFKSLAVKENYKLFISWLSENLDKLEVDEATKKNIELSFEEIYTNIFSYAYSFFSQGDVEVSICRENNDIVLKFVDWGTPYDPTQKPDPDIDLAPEDRPIGGLGIFMVKQLSKSVEYNYDNANILTIKF